MTKINLLLAMIVVVFSSTVHAHQHVIYTAEEDVRIKIVYEGNSEAFKKRFLPVDEKLSKGETYTLDTEGFRNGLYTMYSVNSENKLVHYLPIFIHESLPGGMVRFVKSSMVFLSKSQNYIEVLSTRLIFSLSEGDKLPTLALDEVSAGWRGVETREDAKNPIIAIQTQAMFRPALNLFQLSVDGKILGTFDLNHGDFGINSIVGMVHESQMLEYKFKTRPTE
jgi:hypothetical protein